MTAARDEIIEPWRPGREADVPEIARLLSQLGYPTTPDLAAARLDRLTAMTGAVPSVLLVARSGHGGPVTGLCCVMEVGDVAFDPIAEVRALVVDAGARGGGTGQRLMGAAEAWARGAGYDAIRLFTNERRTDAHRFYERLGYGLAKTSRVYRKDL